MTRTTRLMMSAVAIGVTATLAACSGGAADDADTPDSSQTEAASSSGEDVEGSAQAAGLDPANLPKPVHTGQVPATVDGDPDATMIVDFYGLNRDGQTVIAQFGLTVNSDADVSQDLWEYLGRTKWAPHLIDTKNLTKHKVLSNYPDTAKTRHQSVTFKPGQTFYTFAVFAAPPNDVQTVSVSPIDGAPLIRDVVIQ